MQLHELSIRTKDSWRLEATQEQSWGWLSHCKAFQITRGWNENQEMRGRGTVMEMKEGNDLRVTPGCDYNSKLVHTKGDTRKETPLTWTSITLF